MPGLRSSLAACILVNGARSAEGIATTAPTVNVGSSAVDFGNVVVGQSTDVTFHGVGEKTVVRLVSNGGFGSAGLAAPGVAFSTENAQKATSLSLNIIAQLLQRPKQNVAALVDYCNGCRARVDPMVAAWEEEFGLLWPKSGSDSESSAAK